jgi:hypothetical protein
VSISFGLMIESLVAFLLMLTIGYCAVLNRRLTRLRADEHSLKSTIVELVAASEIAERAVQEMKRAAHECEDTLGERLRAAEHCCAELDGKVSAGDAVLAKLSRVVSAARLLDNVPAATAPDPKEVAAAAGSFANRLRERVAALAA